nr:reverse transcriptase domain-containing protein [Tanacetum cinerariifolium]
MRHRCIREVGYGIRDTWIDPAEAVPDMAPTTLEKFNTRVTELAELHEHYTQDLYALLEDAQDGRTRISQRVSMDSQRVNLLMVDRMTLQETVWIVEEEAYATQEAWAHSKMESVFNISGCAIENQVKFATCTLLDAALTWWNSQIRTLGLEAYAMTWEVLKKKIMDKYRPQRELKKLEIELWNLKVKGNDVPTYTNRFQELTLICNKFVANENKKIDKYINGVPDNIYGNVKSSKPRTLDETIELKKDLMDQKLHTYAERADHKRKTDDTSRNNHGYQQQPFKKQMVAKVYNMGTGERKPYEGSFPKCTRCQRHHNGPCTQKCHKCNKVGHFARDCRSSGNANVANAQRDAEEQEWGNRNAQGWVYKVRNAEKNENAPMNPDFNVVTDLMPVELGSFDVIIRMDWLRRCHAVIVCDEKLVQIPYENETLTFHGNKSNNGRESLLTVISCTKAQEYMSKGCQIFMAQIFAKKEEDKSEGKQLKDVPIVRDFPEVFPEDLLSLPPARPVKFQIDLIPGAAPVARAPYRLAPSEMKEFSKQP